MSVEVVPGLAVPPALVRIYEGYEVGERLGDERDVWLLLLHFQLVVATTVRDPCGGDVEGDRGPRQRRDDPSHALIADEVEGAGSEGGKSEAIAGSEGGKSEAIVGGQVVKALDMHFGDSKGVLRRFRRGAGP